MTTPRTNSIGETISAHDSLEDLPHMGEISAPAGTGGGGEQADEGIRCEACDGSGRVVETIDVDVPGHNRAGSYQCTVSCPDCDGAGHASVDEFEKLRPDFERLANKNAACGLKRSRKGTYVNPSIARDWKWFQLGSIAALTKNSEATP